MERELARVQRGENLAVLCLDLDHFKSVNDTLGHPVGDSLLKAVAERLRQKVRDTDIVARLGGDEFAIVQIAAEQPRGAIVLADRLIEALSKPFDLTGHQLVIGTSIGIALAPSDGLDTDQLIKNADMALYRAKADGRGVFRFFEPEMDAKMQARRTLEIDLRKALVEGEFELFYQPLVNLQSNEISGFEALLRWNHPTRGLVPPSEFIPIAEEMGLIVPLGEQVLRQACTEAAGWPGDIRVAVNLSPVQFKSKTLALAVTTALASSGLPPQRLELEITESVLLQDNEATLTTLHQLRALGVRISMDDFGTGYSSLSYLRSFPFDKIKIDQSFVQDMSGGEDDSVAIIRAVAGLGRNLGMATTAEGVETQEQLGYLRQEGCSEVHGYLFSRPMPARDVPSLLEKVREDLRSAA
jgi:diguanylate cyclase (GGDEF)-like protein